MLKSPLGKIQSFLIIIIIVITHVKALSWSKDSTIENETINFPRKSLRAVVMLFRNKTVTDSEEFVFPNIETVKITIEGTPSQIYSQGIPKNRFYDEGKRLFGNDAENHLMTIRSFYKKHFALVIDLRNIEDNNLYVDCHVFIISDGMVQVIR